jgi:hypothetical protein
VSARRLQINHAARAKLEAAEGTETNTMTTAVTATAVRSTNAPVKTAVTAVAKAHMVVAIGVGTAILGLSSPSV